MKKCLSLLLALSMLLGGTAIAEDTAPAYVPGSVISGLFSQAYEEGNVVCADITLDLALNKEVLGIAGEDAEMADAILEILNTAVITVASAKTEDTLVLLLNAIYPNEDGSEGPYVSARIGLSYDGLYLETSLLPGERISANWETLLATLGADDATVQQILALRDIDPALLMEQVQQIAASVPVLVQQVASPYLDIVTAFISTLPAESEQDVAAEGYFPAAKTEVNLTLTQKAMGELIAQLAAQLSGDPVLSPLLDAVLTNPQIMGDNAMTTAALCENIRAAAAQMTDESTPLYLLLGFDENEALLYTSAVVMMADGSNAVCNIVDATSHPVEGTGYIVELFTTDSAENYSGMYVSWLYTGDPADQNLFDLSILSDVTIQNAPLMSLEYYIGCEPMTTEENLPGYNGYQSMTISITETESSTPVSVVSSAQFQQYLTADGGETQLTYGTTDTYVGETQTQATSETYFTAIPSEDGPFGRYAEYIAQPASGIDSAMVDVGLYTIPYTPEERTLIIALETATEQDLSDLQVRLMTNVQPVMDALFERLPTPVLEAISGDLAAEAPADVGAEMDAAPDASI